MDVDEEIDEDVDEWELERRRNIIESRRGIAPAHKVACRDCGDEVPYVLSPNGKKMLLHPGTGCTYAFLEERPGGDFIAVTSPTEGMVVRNSHTADDLYGYRFYEHHSINCRVGRGKEIRKRIADRRDYLKRKYQAPSAPDAPPADWDVNEPAHDDFDDR